MYETDNGIGPPARPGYRLSERGLLRDLSLYEDLIANGVAAAKAGAASSTTSPPGGWPCGWWHSSSRQISPGA